MKAAVRKLQIKNKTNRKCSTLTLEWRCFVRWHAQINVPETIAIFTQVYYFAILN